MPVRRLVLFIAVSLAAAGTASAFAVGAQPATTSLSSGGSPATTDESLPDLEIPADVIPTTTTTALATTTSAPTTSTTLHQHLDTVVTTPTTAKPTPTTTVATPTTIPSNKATIYVKNTFARAVEVEVSDESLHVWRLEPGEAIGPFTIPTSTVHGDYAAAFAAEDQKCGYRDGDDYFRGGHEYKLVVGTDPQNCANLAIHDLTTSTTRYVGQRS